MYGERGFLRGNNRGHGRRTPGLPSAAMIRTDSAMSSTHLQPADFPLEPRHATVPSFDGTVLHYDVYDMPSPSAVLVVPGFWRDRRHPSMVRLARFLNAEGYRA